MLLRRLVRIKPNKTIDRLGALPGIINLITSRTPPQALQLHIPIQRIDKHPTKPHGRLGARPRIIRQQLPRGLPTPLFLSQQQRARGLLHPPIDIIAGLGLEPRQHIRDDGQVRVGRRAHVVQDALVEASRKRSRLLQLEIRVQEGPGRARRQVAVLAELGRDGRDSQPPGDEGRGDGPGRRVPDADQVRVCGVVSEVDHLPVPGFVVGDARVPHQRHQVRFRDGGFGERCFLERRLRHVLEAAVARRVVLALHAVDLEDVEGVARRRVPPPLFDREVYQVGRAHVVLRRGRRRGIRIIVQREILNVPGIQDADIVRAQTLSSPQFLAPSELPDDPALVGVGNEVRVPAVVGVAVPLDQVGDDLDALPGGARALEHAPRQVAVLEPGLRVGRHGVELGAVLGPDVAHGHGPLVDAAVGERRREPFEVAVLHA